MFLGVLFPEFCAYAAQYNCAASKIFLSGTLLGSDEVARGQFSLRINEKPSFTLISRCSSSSLFKKITCDEYKVDKIVYDENSKIKKFYFFRGQFDVQLFSDMQFIENNGRGGIFHGTCKVVSP